MHRFQEERDQTLGRIEYRIRGARRKGPYSSPRRSQWDGGGTLGRGPSLTLLLLLPGGWTADTVPLPGRQTLFANRSLSLDLKGTRTFVEVPAGHRVEGLEATPPGPQTSWDKLPDTAPRTSAGAEPRAGPSRDHNAGTIGRIHLLVERGEERLRLLFPRVYHH